jgi:hypothetical protein
LSGTNDYDFTQISTTGTSPDTGTYYFTSDGLVGGTARDGTYTLKVIVTDDADNQTESTLYTVKVDRTAPVTIDDAPSAVPASTPFTLTLTPSDAPVSSGISNTYYTTDGTTPTVNSSEGTTISSDDMTFSGDYFTVKYFSVDNLGNSESVRTATNQPTDTDTDGMFDWWEDLYGLDKNSSADASTDGDSDSRTNLQEFQSDTNPTVADSDGDSIDDGVEASDGTDPNDSGDHRAILLFPQTTSLSTTDSPFTFIAKAPVGQSVAVKNASGTVLGTGESDASGRVSIELELALEVDYTLSAEFIHGLGQLVETPSILIHVSGSGDNPVFGNLINNQLFIQGFIDLTMTGKTSAKVEVFEIRDANLFYLTQTTTDGSGAGTITFPNTFVDGQILVIDQTNALTSQIIDVERGVFVSGQVTDASSVPIPTVTVQFIDGSTVYQTTTDSNGEYSLTVQANKEYLVKIFHQSYVKDERTVQLVRSDLRISPSLVSITDYTQLQGSGDIIDVDASGKTALRWSGMTRDALLKVAEKGYAFSLKQAEESSEGIEEKVLTRKDEFGREVFVGYKAGRLSVDEFKVQPYIAQRVTGLLGAERRVTTTSKGGEKLHTSAVREEICLNKTSTTAQFTDVSPRHSYSAEIMKMHSYGVIQANKENKFLPDNPVTWNEVLQLLFASDCIPVEDYKTLRNANLPTIKDFPLENSLETLLFYTALKEGLIDVQIDREKSPTRQEVLLALSTVFELEINPKAVNVSYSDVAKTDPIAPVIVAAKLSGWFKNFVSGRFFYHNKALTRGEFSTWFVGAVEYKQELLKPENAFKRFLSKFKEDEETKKARLGTRQTQTSDVETILRARKYYQEEKKERLYLPLRKSWNPVDPNTDRAPIEIHKKTNFKRYQKPGTLRESR